ncbi:MAG: SLC13/DASS family transporter [Solobacterium sp.]|nr:SLC13/DASS family transporter [Eubacterium sp.]MBR3345164.1 SLC13/DASS family transporter [Solobacterium sp.]
MAIAVLSILAIGLVLFITEWIPLPVTAMSMCVAFYLTGAVDSSTALAAFSSGTAMIIVSMAIIGEAVFKTGGADKIGRLLTKFADNEKKLIFVTVLFAGIMSGFLSNTGAAGLLIALILGISASTGMKRSKLMYPVIVGCCFGGGITIVGTTSGPFLKETLEGLGTGLTFSFFEWAPLSLLLLLISAVYMATIGYKLLPENPNNEDTYDAGNTASADFSGIPAWKTWLSIGIMFMTLIGMIFEKQIGIKLHFMAIIGAIIAVASGCLTVKQATRAIPTSGLIIYAALVPVASAMTNSGAAELIANAAQSVFTSVGSPLLILILIFLFITPLTNFMSNAATIILFTPIALLISEAIGINPKAILTAVRFAASIAIATPVAMPANSMAVEPGGYRFMDYVRPGLPLTLICVVVSIAYIAIFYPLV